MNALPNAKGRSEVIKMGLSISLGAFVLAYNSVCLTSVASLLKLKNNLSDAELVYQLSIATSCFGFGAFLSPILYKKYANFFGELKGLLLIDVAGIATLLIQLINLRFEFLVATRLVLGLLIGVSTAIIPVYLNSVSPKEMSGKLGSFNQVLQTLGVAVAYMMGYVLNDQADDEFRWRIYLGFPIVFFIIRIISLQVFYPFDLIERHIQKKQTEKLRQYCKMVYWATDSETMDRLIQSKAVLKKSQNISSSTHRRRFIIAMVVIASNQLTGINGILFYAKQLFNKVTDGRVYYTQILMILLSVLQVVATLISTEIIDKQGRKKMLLTGQTCIAITLFGIFIFDTLVSRVVGSEAGQVGVVFLLFIHVLIMNMTLGPVCIVYCAEIVEDITWIIITLKGCSLAVALTAEYMIEYLGVGIMFFIFFVLTTSALIYLRPRLRETKGLTKLQIYSLFAKDNRSLIECKQGSQNSELQTFIDDRPDASH